MFHYTIETNKSIDEAISSLENHLKDEQFGVLWKLDINEKLQEKGIDFDQTFRILEVCNPHEAKTVLTENHLAGYFLPCKIVVYDDDGKTKIGMPKVTSLFSPIGEDRLQEIARDIEKRLMACIDKSV